MSKPDPICLPLAEDFALLCEAVRGAGAVAKVHYDAADSKVWEKSKNNPVTDADLAVNAHLASMLKPARPDYGWLSEETKDDHSRHACPRSWVVDPIDGTRAFIDRKPPFAVSVALIESGRAVAGAVFNPLKNEFYAAMEGNGATLNGKPLHVTERTEVAGCKMVGYPRKFRRQGWPDMNISISNSMAYRMVMVASGQMDATVSFTPKSDWDVAAAELIVREAGGRVSNLDGQAFRYDAQSVREFGVVCANPALHDLLLERTQGIRARVKASDNIARDFGHLGTSAQDRNPDQESNRLMSENVDLLHIVFGGELVDPMKTKFVDLKDMDFVGAFPNYEAAHKAWKSAAQRTVDNAHMRYFILHAHELIDPDKDGVIG